MDKEKLKDLYKNLSWFMEKYCFECDTSFIRVKNAVAVKLSDTISNE